MTTTPIAKIASEISTSINVKPRFFITLSKIYGTYLSLYSLIVLVKLRVTDASPTKRPLIVTFNLRISIVDVPEPAPSISADCVSKVNTNAVIVIIRLSVKLVHASAAALQEKLAPEGRY